MKSEAEIKQMIRDSQDEHNKTVDKGFNRFMYIEGYIQALKDVLEKG